MNFSFQILYFLVAEFTFIYNFSLRYSYLFVHCDCTSQKALEHIFSNCLFTNSPYLLIPTFRLYQAQFLLIAFSLNYESLFFTSGHFLMYFAHWDSLLKLWISVIFLWKVLIFIHAGSLLCCTSECKLCPSPSGHQMKSLLSYLAFNLLLSLGSLESPLHLQF